jgi:hypothetical protein
MHNATHHEGEGEPHDHATVADAMWRAVYYVAKPQMIALDTELLPSVLNLLDQMLPTELVQIPVAADWLEIVQVPA